MVGKFCKENKNLTGSVNINTMSPVLRFSSNGVISMRKLLHNVPVWCKSVVFASFTFALALGPVLIFGPESWGDLLGYPLGFAALMIGFRLMERADENNTSNHDPDDQKYLHAAMNEIEDLLRPLEKQFEKAGIYLNQALCRLRTFSLSQAAFCMSVVFYCSWN